MTKIIPAEKARQGNKGVNILIVLVAGLLLAMAAWAGAEFYGEMIDGGATTQTAPAQ